MYAITTDVTHAPTTISLSVFIEPVFQVIV